MPDIIEEIDRILENDHANPVPSVTVLRLEHLLSQAADEIRGLRAEIEHYKKLERDQL